MAFRIELLGAFRVSVGARTVPDTSWRRRKPAALLKLLALAPGHRLHREQAMDLLWPELDPQAAGANLRKALYHARQALDTAEAAELIVSAGELLLLPSDRTRVDVDEFRAAVADARRTGDPETYARAVELHGDGLLPEDAYEDWAVGPRDELRSELAAALGELAGLLEGRGDIDGAAKAVRELVSTDPLREESHAWLIRLYALAGRRSDAERQYEHLRSALAEIGVEPGAETQRLYEEVRTRQAFEPELTADLWERVGDLRVRSGDAPGAAKAYGAALEARTSPGDIARLRRKSAGAWLLQHGAEQAEPHLQAAEALGQEAERTKLVSLRATQAWQRGDLGLAHRLGEEARALAEADGDPEDVATAHEVLAIVSHLRGDWRQGLHLELDRLGSDGAPTAQLDRVFDIHHCIGQYHLYGDGLADDVEGYARRTLELAEEAGAVRAQAFAWCLLGESLLLHAHWEEAGGCLARSCELHASLGTHSGALPWQRLAELAVGRGNPDETGDYLRRAAAIATVSPMAMHLWGRIHATAALAALELGDPEAATRSVREAASAAARYGDCPTCSALLNPVAAEAFAVVGDRDGAQAHAEAAARVATFFESSAWRAMGQSAQGSVALVEGHTDEARELFRTAAGSYDRAGQPYWAERSLAQAAAA